MTEQFDERFGIKIYPKQILCRFFCHQPIVQKLMALGDVDFHVLVWIEQQRLCFVIRNETFDSTELNSKFVDRYLQYLSDERQEDLDQFIANRLALSQQETQ